jgi:hypothetical protein
MTDFRSISPRSISWIRGGRGNAVLATRTSGEKNIVFQLPRLNCFISKHSAGMFRIDFKLDPSDKTHAQFVDWIADLEQSAIGTWSSQLQQSKLIYRDGFRVMIFSDTKAFDENSRLSVDYFKARSASAIVQLAGLWTTDSKYGIRLNIKQFKFFEEAIEYAPSPDRADESASATNFSKPMFIMDD